VARGAVGPLGAPEGSVICSHAWFGLWPQAYRGKGATTNLEICERNCVLRGTVGSTAHGVELEGTDDRDEMGIFVEPPEYVCGLKSLDHYIHREGLDRRIKGDHERSGPGDLDLVLYSLRKYCRLAGQGNPSVLMLMWLPHYSTITFVGEMLLGIREAFVTRKAGERFLGYLVSQKRAMTGERKKKVTRPELVERHGYDTKFAAHAVRLGLQGVEFLTEGAFHLPMTLRNRELVLSVREGKVPLPEVLRLIEDVQSRLEGVLLSKKGEFRETADVRRINDFLVEAHFRWWSHVDRVPPCSPTA